MPIIHHYHPVFVAVATAIRRHVGPVVGIEPLTPIDALGLDRLAAIDITCALEDEYDITIADDECQAVLSVGDLVRLVERKRAATLAFGEGRAA